MRYHLLLLALLSMITRHAALAQPPARTDSLHSQQPAGPCPCCRDTTTTTERTNSSALLAGAGVVSDRTGRVYAGLGLELGSAITPRLTVGVRGWFGIARSSGSDYGYEATRPALAIHSLAGSVRYQLLNTRRWRMEAVGGIGAGAVQLLDRDQTVKSGRYEHPATVFFSVHPLAEAGAGLTYKLGRQFWLSSRLGYQYIPGTSGLGAAGEFSGWQVSLYATVPWGWPQTAMPGTK